MSPETRSIILNPEVIALDQDSLGIQGLRHSSQEGLEFWFKPLMGGDWAFCILNRSMEPRTYRIDWQAFNFTDEVSGRATNFNTHTYALCNLWKGKGEGTTRKARTVEIPAQDVVLYRLILKPE